MNLNNLIAPFTCDNYAVRSNKISFGNNKLANSLNNIQSDTFERRNTETSGTQPKNPANIESEEAHDNADTSIQEVQSYAEEIKSYAEGIRKNAEGIIKEVAELFKNGGMSDGEKDVKMFLDDKGHKTIEEYAPDGSLLRKSTLLEFGEESLTFIDEYTKDGQNKYAFSGERLFAYDENISETADMECQSDKFLSFNNKGKLENYFEGYTRFRNGTSKIEKRLNFNEEGNLEIYAEGEEDS